MCIIQFCKPQICFYKVFIFTECKIIFKKIKVIFIYMKQHTILPNTTEQLFHFVFPTQLLEFSFLKGWSICKPLCFYEWLKSTFYAEYSNEILWRGSEDKKHKQTCSCWRVQPLFFSFRNRNNPFLNQRGATPVASLCILIECIKKGSKLD